MNSDDITFLVLLGIITLFYLFYFILTNKREPKPIIDPLLAQARNNISAARQQVLASIDFDSCLQAVEQFILEQSSQGSISFNYIVDVDANINLILARKLRDTLIKKGFFASVSAYQSKGPIVLVIDLLL